MSSRVEHGEGRQFGDRDHGPALLLTGADPPEADETEGRVGPEDKRRLPALVGAQEVRPCPAADRRLGRDAGRQRLGVDPKIAIEVQAGSSPLPCFGGAALTSRPNLACTVRQDNHPCFAGSRVGPKRRPGRNAPWWQVNNVEWATRSASLVSFGTRNVHVIEAAITQVGKKDNWNGYRSIQPGQPQLALHQACGGLRYTRLAKARAAGVRQRAPNAASGSLSTADGNRADREIGRNSLNGPGNRRRFQNGVRTALKIHKARSPTSLFTVATSGRDHEYFGHARVG